MRSDKNTIGLTEANKSVIEHVTTELGWFRTQIDAGKFALALAIDREVPPGEVEGAGTVWNVGSFDSTNELRDLLRILYPDWDGPYRLAEHFINRGLEIIGKEIEKHPHIDISHFLLTP
ncbi:MAG TPA: hypothetical protein PKD55_16695 [Bellilinea sp.]|nr:hypothetical protein [Bellilinea sp.]